MKLYIKETSFAMSIMLVKRAINTLYIIKWKTYWVGLRKFYRIFSALFCIVKTTCYAGSFHYTKILQILRACIKTRSGICRAKEMQTIPWWADKQWNYQPVSIWWIFCGRAYIQCSLTRKVRRRSIGSLSTFSNSRAYTVNAQRCRGKLKNIHFRINAE